MSDSNRLRIAIQKSGRLREDSIDLIKKLGIHISRNSSFLKFESKNFPVEFLYLRDDDIPGYEFPTGNPLLIDLTDGTLDVTAAKYLDESRAKPLPPF